MFMCLAIGVSGKIMILLLVFIALWTFFVTVMWKIYLKMGLEGWLVLIPIYGQYVLYRKLGCKKQYWILLAFSLVSCALEIVTELCGLQQSLATMLLGVFIVLYVATLIFMFKAMIRLSKAFGHGIGYALGLLILSAIFFPILAFSKDEYLGDDEGY